MEVVILAAGYATRLYPLTRTQPKPLLPVAGKPMIEYVLDNLAPIRDLTRVYVVTNAKFADHFRRWADGYQRARPQPPLTIVDDQSTDDTNKLGAIGDLHLVITRERLAGDLLVVAGDNLFSQTLEGFARFGRSQQAPVVGVYDVGDLEAVRQYNAIAVDAQRRLTFFEEKPARPASTLTAIALYYYPPAALPLIRQYVAEGNHPDQPGRLVQWMYTRVPFYTWPVPGLWYDIGSQESLAEAHRVFAAGC
jgi:glucose-1-phosphate thymidylyltransferase